MSDLCADVILGRRLLSRYSEVTLCYGGSDPPLRIPCETQLVLGVAAAKLKPPGIFQFLAPYCKPVAANSRRYSQEDSDFIKSEIHRVLDASVIEPANYYPWSAQVLAVNQTGGKKRLCVNHSVAINRFTYRDAYPLPRIYEIVSKIAQDAFSFSIDLNSVYHQVPRIPEERPMTAFEADGKLFQYCRLPFGVANGTFTVTSMILTVTDRCYWWRAPGELAMFLRSCENGRANFQLIHAENCSKGTRRYRVSQGQIQLDPSRLQPLMALEPPSGLKGWKKVCGLFAYYAKYIENFSKKSRPLQTAKEFPLTGQILEVFNTLKNDLITASPGFIKDDISFEVETDVFDYAIAATLPKKVVLSRICQEP